MGKVINGIETSGGVNGVFACKSRHRWDAGMSLFFEIANSGLRVLLAAAPSYFGRVVPAFIKHFFLTALVSIALLSPSRAGELFDHGLRDRAAWENWFTGLNGDFKAGAEYWAGQRSLPNPGGCFGTFEFTQGCNEAKARLTPTDVMRKQTQEYRAGWNAYGYVPMPAISEQDAATAQAIGALNAKRAAETERKELAAREARADAERVRANLSRQRAEQEAADARADARLKYEDRVKQQIAMEKAQGYTPIEFDDFALDKRALVASKAKIAINGFYKSTGEKSEFLLRAQVPETEDYRLALLTEDADRDTRKFLLKCRDDAPRPCPIVLLGTVVECISTAKLGAEKTSICLKVDDAWYIPEPAAS
jgi:hypothetical protein